MSPFGLWVYGGGADTSSHEEQSQRFAFSIVFFSKFHDFTTTAERTYDGENAITLIQFSKTTGRLAYNMINDGYRILFVVDVANGKRYTFALVVGDNDDKLTRLS